LHVGSSLFGVAARTVDNWSQVGLASDLDWASPVLFFGQLPSARIATVGLNPSSREFVNSDGGRLADHDRRLPTLDSLALQRWDDANAIHMAELIDACENYFERRPYDLWFRVLDTVMKDAGYTFYGAKANACHVDLVPFATRSKWGSLAGAGRARLLDLGGDALGHLVRASSLEALILNGRSVVEGFSRIADRPLFATEMNSWDLPRRDGGGVRGVAFEGAVTRIGGVELGREVVVLGYNHNLQSSYGVTSAVLGAIRAWLADRLEGPDPRS
jgi:hypothetical protein